MPNVVVVGAGIAGLSAAISLRRAGHQVDIYERSAMNNEAGAAIHIQPNVSRFLIAWGLDPVRWRFVKSRHWSYIDPFTLEETVKFADEESIRKVGGADIYFAHRVDLHNALKWMATREDGPGTPVTIHVETNVVGYDPSAPSITLEGGRKVYGDLVVGADGVHSLATETILGHKIPPEPTSQLNYCYRFLIPAEALDEDPETRFWNEGRDGWLRVVADNEANRRVVTYSCRDNMVHNFVGMFYEEDPSFERKENWHSSVDVSYVLDKFAGFNPKLLRVISKATDVGKWPLLFRHPNPAWSKGRLILAGDSAHPMLPHHGQGGAQSIEDGIALGIAMYGASTAEEIEQRLQTYTDVRFNRASAIQILSHVGQDQAGLIEEQLRPYLAEDEIPTTLPGIMEFNCGFDVVGKTVSAMRARDAAFTLPPGFFETDY